MIEEITMPTVLLVAFLGWLRGCEICPVCHVDLGPVLDELEKLEAQAEGK